MAFFPSLFARSRSGEPVPRAEADKALGPAVPDFAAKSGGLQILSSKDLADLVAVHASPAGVGVNPTRAMQFSTVWACVRLLAEVLATVPIHVYLRQRGGGKQRVTDTAMAELLGLAPNSWQTVFEYIDFLTTSLCMRGNSYAFVNRTGRGETSELIPLPPSTVTPKRDGYEIRYQIRFEDGTTETLPADRIHHVRGMSLDGLEKGTDLNFT